MTNGPIYCLERWHPLKRLFVADSGRIAPMEPFRALGKMLFWFGLLFVAIGVLLMAVPKLPFRLGRLPGDIVYHGKNMTLYFPLVTCLVLSVALTVLFWILSFLGGKK